MTLLQHKHAQELRDTWQARALAEATGRLRAVVLVVLFRGYREAMPILLRVVFPGFRDIERPFLCSDAMIANSGKLICGMIDHSGVRKQVALYDNESDLLRELRDLADRLKLSDADRVEMFQAVQNWIVADLRIDHEGRKLAS